MKKGVTNVKVRTDENMLRALDADGRVSTWDMADGWHWPINELVKKELIVSVPMGYPWHKYKLTEKGRALITQTVDGPKPVILKLVPPLPPGESAELWIEQFISLREEIALGRIDNAMDWLTAAINQLRKPSR